MSTPLFLLTIDVATIVCAVLLGARILVSQPRSRSALLIALIALGMVCGVLLGRQEYGYWIPPAFRVDVGWWARVFDLARNLTPGLFMLLCFNLFIEQRRFPRWLLILVALQLCLDEPGRAITPQTWRYAYLATQIAPALLQMLFACMALYWTVAEWRGDLVEARRSVRVATLAVAGGIIVASGLAQVLIDQASRANYLAHEMLAAADLAILAFVLFRVTGEDAGHVLDFDSARVGVRTMPAVHPAFLLLGPPVWLALTNLLILFKAPLTHALVNDWGGHLKWIGIFVTGLLAARQDRFWAVLQAHWGKLAAAAAVLLWIQSHINDPAWSLVSGLYAWAVICALCGFAKTILNHSSPLLSHLTEAVLPVYVLHQPILLVTAYWLFPLGLPLPIEVLLLAGTTGLGSFAIYEGLIRPFSFCRFLFGLKPKQGGT